MASKRESVLLALHDRLRTALLPIGADFDRNVAWPKAVKREGMVILRDGDPGEPDYTMSPMTWHWQHRAELEVFIQKGSGRETAFDALLVAIGAALEQDRTLGGAVDWCEPEAPQPSDIPVEAGLELRAVTLGVWLHYDTTDPLQ